MQIPVVFPVHLAWMMDEVKPRRNSPSHNGTAITGRASKCPKDPLEHPSAAPLSSQTDLILQIITLGIIIYVHVPN